MDRNPIHKISCLLLLCCYSIGLNAQEVNNEYQARTEFKLSYELMDDWKLIFNPELRFDETFSIDKYILEFRTEYDPFKRFTLGAAWRFVVNERETKDTEYLQRYAFDAGYKLKFNRWKPALRIRYTNYSEDADSQLLRYKAGLDYNIKGCKLTPYVGTELFHQFNEGELLKVRYSLGADYRLSKKSSLSLAYKLDYFLQEYENKHIMNIKYKFKF